MYQVPRSQPEPPPLPRVFLAVAITALINSVIAWLAAQITPNIMPFVFTFMLIISIRPLMLFWKARSSKPERKLKIKDMFWLAVIIGFLIVLVWLNVAKLSILMAGICGGVSSIVGTLVAQKIIPTVFAP